jgi:hypothetical protein
MTAILKENIKEEINLNDGNSSLHMLIRQNADIDTIVQAAKHSPH